MTSIRVLIVDDSAQVRQDLRTLLLLAGMDSGTPLEIVGEASNGCEAIQQVEALLPEVVLMDLAMPVMDGWTATRLIKMEFPYVQIVALTVYGDPVSRQEAYRSGVKGFIEKGAPAIEIIQAIRQCGNQTGVSDNGKMHSGWSDCFL